MFPDRAAGFTYYIFKSYAETTSFTNGQMLHIRAYPNSNWDTVQQN